VEESLQTTPLQEFHVQTNVKTHLKNIRITQARREPCIHLLQSSTQKKKKNTKQTPFSLFP
jgi:hypothetical protein